MKIILTTLNSRYAHTSLALRYIYANMQEFQSSSTIMEFSINENIYDIAQRLLDAKATIIGIGVYIWNASEVSTLVEILKSISPDTIIILGGPEVSHQPLRVDFSRADFIIQGEGDMAFYTLCKDIKAKKTLPKIIKKSVPKLSDIKLPYRYYSDDDIKNRYIYIEASRGCPFECEFCLSSLDERVRTFDLDLLLSELELLWQRGARNFKFVDRTFNLNIASATKLIDFFLAKNEQFFTHFEVVPDNFPQRLKDKLAQFPKHSLQLEIGIQTLNPEIAKNISRPLEFEKIKENIKFLLQHTNAHLHLDLIIALPQEDLDSFGRNLDELCSMGDFEIQLGILKKLSGTTINRHDIEHKMIYSQKPPYEVLQTSKLSFQDLQNMKRFARFWDLFYNSSNFKNSIKLLWEGESVYKNFYSFSLFIYQKTLSTYQISLDRQVELLFNYLVDIKKVDKTVVAKRIIEDILRFEGRVIPKILRGFGDNLVLEKKLKSGTFNKRQH